MLPATTGSLEILHTVFGVLGPTVEADQTVQTLLRRTCIPSGVENVGPSNKVTSDINFFVGRTPIYHIDQHPSTVPQGRI